ncbi:MAG: hypothetical protein WAX28_14555 [Corynebacterium variabile]|uniref:hypothetical protein n=1 Tax=Corynebacterium variabile TaxID=1727 RepID=UPI003BB56B98
MTTQKSTLSPDALAKLLGVSGNTVRTAGRGDGLTLGGRTIHPVIIGCRQSWPAAPIMAWLEGRDEA